MRASPPAVVPAAALSKEWLLGNGVGAFASGTASGAHVREFHALLATAAPHGRLTVRLRRLAGRALVDGRAVELDSQGEARAHGLARATIESFERTPAPCWVYRIGETRIEKRVWLVRDEPAVVAVFRHLEGPAARVSVSPQLAERQAELQSMPGRVRCLVDDAHLLTLWHDGAFLPVRAHQSAHDGAADAAVALGASESGFVPGLIEASLAPGGALHVVASTHEHLLRDLATRDRLGTPPPRTLAGCVAALEADERAFADAAARAAREAARRTTVKAMAHRSADAESDPDVTARPAPHDAWVPRLARALDLVHPPDERRGVLGATAPGLAAQAVSALRAVRGLVALERVETAREILLAYGHLVRDGLVPSGFDAGGRPRYDSPLPSLWLVIQAELFARRTGEREFARHALLPPITVIVERFRAGAPGGVRVDDDGLLAIDQDGAAVKRADVNALWYAAQAALGQLARTLGQQQSGAFYLAWAREHQARFNDLLWDETTGACYVAVGEHGAIRGLEATQVLAASLAPPVLPPERARRQVEALERELWTPAGLREAPGSSRILTEWAAAFLTARGRAYGRSAEAQQSARVWLDGFERLLDRYAAGHVPEVFEAASDAALDDAPLHYAGDPVSAAASADLLRFCVEELDRADLETGAVAAGQAEPEAG